MFTKFSYKINNNVKSVKNFRYLTYVTSQVLLDFELMSRGDSNLKITRTKLSLKMAINNNIIIDKLNCSIINHNLDGQNLTIYKYI